MMKEINSNFKGFLIFLVIFAAIVVFVFLSSIIFPVQNGQDGIAGQVRIVENYFYTIDEESMAVTPMVMEDNNYIVHHIVATPPKPEAAIPNYFEQEVNRIRKEHGLNELVATDCLRSVAYRRATEMNDTGLFSHDRPNGKRYSTAYYQDDWPYCWPLEEGATHYSTGENLAYDWEDRVAVIPAWLNSPTHRDILLSQQYNQIGIAEVGDYIAMEVTN